LLLVVGEGGELVLVSAPPVSHLSPGNYEPINPYGTLNFDVADMLKRPRRPRRL